MLSDWHPKGQVSSLYGVYNVERGNPIRSVFIIDVQGVIRWKKTYGPGELPDVPALLAELDNIT